MRDRERQSTFCNLVHRANITKEHDKDGERKERRQQVTIQIHSAKHRETLTEEKRQGWGEGKRRNGGGVREGCSSLMLTLRWLAS